MGLEGQLHHIIIHSKTIMKSPSSSVAIRKKGSLKKGGKNVKGKEAKQRKWKWIKSAMIFRMIMKRILHLLFRFSRGFSITDRN